MEKNYKASIIVPVYNASEYLDRCMDTLLSQTLENYEIILVDDGSKDNSGKKCDGYAERNESVTAIHQENAGPAAARNAGLSKAAGEYVAFIDPDDRIEKNYLEVACAQAERFDADIALFDAVRERTEYGVTITEDWGHASYSFTTKDRAEIMSMQRQILYPYMAAKAGDMSFKSDVPLAAPWDKLYRRQFLVDNGLKFPEKLRVLDDMCFNFEAFGAAGCVTYIPTCLYHYIVEESSITNSFRQDRISKDMQVFDYLKDSINRMGFDRDEAARFRQALYARIIKSFAIALRLYFFNPKNEKGEEEICRELVSYMDTMPYKLAFKGIKLSVLEPKLKAVTMACRMRMPRVLKVMYDLQYKK